jgi:hypothetical protein
MTSVAIDFFSFPKAKSGGQMYDTIAVCVDRHSGWIVAAPALSQGLTGEGVARLFFSHGWNVFDTPSLVHTDMDPRWLGSWWKTMCAMLGIRHAVAQPHHHRDNGRAERAGGQLRDMLRKLHTQHATYTWVEALPIALRHIHDQPGVSGYSPYEIVFGRQRSLANLPYTPPRERFDAHEFFKGQARIEREVAQYLNDEHSKRATKHATQHVSPPPLKIGQNVVHRRVTETH